MNLHYNIDIYIYYTIVKKKVIINDYYYYYLLYTYCSACINQGGVLLLNVNPMLICVPCRFGYQFISIFSSIFLFIYFFVYLIIYILLLLLYIPTHIYIHIHTYPHTLTQTHIPTYTKTNTFTHIHPPTHTLTTPPPTGERCEINYNECSSNPCQNEGLCYDMISAYSCRCLEDCAGVHCEFQGFTNYATY